MILLEGKPSDWCLSVKSLKEARADWLGFDHVITIEDADFADGLRISNAKVGQSVFRFDDTDKAQSRHRAPTKSEVRDMLMIGRAHPSKRLLIHCLQGQSRSAAIALGILADRLGPGREHDAVSELMSIRPSAVCNLLIVRHADELLGREGALIAAWDSYVARSDKLYGIYLLRTLGEEPETPAQDTSSF